MTQAFLDQISMTPPLIADALGGYRDAVRLVLSTPEIYAIRRVVIFGSGDSHIAGLAAQSFFEAVTGLDVLVQTALEVSRHTAVAKSDAWIRSTLFIAISNSGEAARVVEAARRLKSRSGKVMALTAAPEGRLAGSSALHLLTPAMQLPRSPGYATFLAVVLMLQMLALRFGEVRMHVTMDEAQALRRRMEDCVAALPAITSALAEPTRQAAQAVSGKRAFELLGTGPGLAMAAFGAAKLVEAAGVHASAVDLEEWAHLNYFVADPADTVTMLVLPAGGAARDRAAEIARYATTLGRPLITIGQALPHVAGTMLEILSDDPESLSPLRLATPLALFAAELSHAIGAEHGRGNAGPWADSRGAATVQASTISEDLTP